MAEALFKSTVEEKNAEINVSSAGINALVGRPADKAVQQLMQERGLDISNHRARQISHEMILEANLILTMGTAQTQEIEEKFPHARGKVFRLGHHMGFDVVDPFKRADTIFVQSMTQIEQGLEDWYKIILG